MFLLCTSLALTLIYFPQTDVFEVVVTLDLQNGLMLLPQGANFYLVL